MTPAARTNGESRSNAHASTEQLEARVRRTGRRACTASVRVAAAFRARDGNVVGCRTKRASGALTIVLASACLVSGCGEKVDKPPPPDMSQLIQDYNDPSGVLD